MTKIKMFAVTSVPVVLISAFYIVYKEALFTENNQGLPKNVFPVF